MSLFKEKTEKSTIVNAGAGFSALLAILFIGLKITGNIDWSWWWVLAPLWIPVALLLCIVIVAYLVIYFSS